MRSNHQTPVFGKGLLPVTCSTQESPPPVSLLSLTPSQKNVTLKDGCGHLSLVLTTEEDGTVTLLNHSANPEISSLSPSD